MDEACVLCSSHFQHFLCDYGKTLLLCRIAEAAPLNMNTAGSGQREPPRLVLEVQLPPLQAQVWGVHAGLTQLYFYHINSY